ncbi:hypothetical protein [Microvirga sesbaniae]|uniref:hypothetical protein n=1 Tax=Microvirga sesbaniae TaxID=681392 RepID=UPI0021CA9A8C|nr:hypothetical protein [Microvirga sp. HBU67692]
MSPKRALCAVLLSVYLELPTQAHDIYSTLTDAAGASCCNQNDCRPAPYRVSPRGVQMYLDADWFDVPDGTIQYQSLPGDTGETRGGHWCGTAIYQQGHRVVHVTHCAILPPNSASAAVRHNE